MSTREDTHDPPRPAPPLAMQQEPDLPERACIKLFLGVQRPAHLQPENVLQWVLDSKAAYRRLHLRQQPREAEAAGVALGRLKEASRLDE